jgi:hypothetical protein
MCSDQATHQPIIVAEGLLAYRSSSRSIYQHCLASNPMRTFHKYAVAVIPGDQPGPNYSVPPYLLLSPIRGSSVVSRSFSSLIGSLE